MSRSNTLYSFDFVAICLVAFLTYCNITVFFDLYQHLEQIGIARPWRGFLIGASSLSTIALFLFASPYVTIRNAVGCAGLGAVVLLGCGLAYLYARDVTGLLAVRLANGVGVYLLTAGCMTMMVSIIPAGRSGQAFSLYSVALLLPYSIVPAASDAVSPYLASMAHGYRDMSLALVPALCMIYAIGRRQRTRGAAPRAAAISLGQMYRNAAAPRIALVLLLNTLYIVTFSSLFFLAKGLFQSLGLDGVGYYFSIQMCCMVLIRAFGNRLFDRVSKVRLIRASFALSAVSFVLAALATNVAGLYASSLAMGIGMGLGSPALYGLMYHIAPPDYKAVDSNLMMLSLQVGNFLGPLIGTWVMHGTGYGGFLLVDAGASLAAVVLTYVLTWRRLDRDGLAGRA
jgi:MFS family permease